MNEQEDPESPDSYSAAAEIARGMSSPRADMSDMAAFNRSMGFGSLSHIDPSEAYVKAMEAAKRPPDKPIHPDAQFYAGVGDLAGAITIQKTKGPALFTMGEELTFGRDNKAKKYAIVPTGETSIMGNDGKVHRVAVSEYARASKIQTVPFRGGDKKAETFRGMLLMANSLFKSLDDLEQSYASNDLYIGSLNFSGTSTNAKRLETQILMDTAAILTGAQTLGGGASGVDIDMVKALVPQAASNLLGGMKGNEKYKLAQLRTFVLERIMGAAEANGVKLVEVANPQPGSSGPRRITGINNPGRR